MSSVSFFLFLISLKFSVGGRAFFTFCKGFKNCELECEKHQAKCNDEDLNRMPKIQLEQLVSKLGFPCSSHENGTGTRQPWEPEIDPTTRTCFGFTDPGNGKSNCSTEFPEVARNRKRVCLCTQSDISSLACPDGTTELEGSCYRIKPLGNTANMKDLEDTCFTLQPQMHGLFLSTEDLYLKTVSKLQSQLGLNGTFGLRTIGQGDKRKGAYFRSPLTYYKWDPGMVNASARSNIYIKPDGLWASAEPGDDIPTTNNFAVCQLTPTLMWETGKVSKFLGRANYVFSVVSPAAVLKELGALNRLDCARLCAARQPECMGFNFNGTCVLLKAVDEMQIIKMSGSSSYIRKAECYTCGMW